MVAQRLTVTVLRSFAPSRAGSSPSRRKPRPKGPHSSRHLPPKGGEDVPFRSVAGRLAPRLREDDREAFQLDVLRPPTYEQLAETLELAKNRDKPYHIVHFDGHGTYADPKSLEEAGEVLSRLR